MYIEIIDVEVKYIYTKINIILNVRGSMHVLPYP
jgi:hypothetical protein